MAKYDKGFSRKDEFTDALIAEFKDDPVFGCGKGPFIFYPNELTITPWSYYAPKSRSVFLIVADATHTDTVPDEVLKTMADRFGFDCLLWRLDFSECPLVRRENIRTGEIDELTVEELTNEVMNKLWSLPMRESERRVWDGKGDGSRTDTPPEPLTADTPLERRVSKWQENINSVHCLAIDLDCVVFKRAMSSITALFETKKNDGTPYWKGWRITENCAATLGATLSALIHYDPQNADGELKPPEGLILYPAPAFLQPYRRHEQDERDEEGNLLDGWDVSAKSVADAIRKANE